MTMSLISTITVGAGGAASIQFTNIPQDATDLLVVLCLRSSSSTQEFVVGNPLLNDVFPSQSKRFGSNGVVISSGSSDYDINGPVSTVNVFSNISVYINNYTSSTNKIVSTDISAENNSDTTTGNRKYIQTATYAVLTAINSFKFINAGTLAEYSTASLYKITKGSDGTTVVT